MLKIDIGTRLMIKLKAKSLESENIHERRDLQELIMQNPEAFFKEINEPGLFFLPTMAEARISETSADRSDLLAVDTDGTIVVIELKRGKDKRQLLQAIAYAGMLDRRQSQWFEGQLGREKYRELELFLDDAEATEKLNYRQRIILVAEEYTEQVLVAANWLKKFGVDLKCIELEMAIDETEETKSHYISCRQIFPLREFEELLPARARDVATGDFRPWKDFVDSLENPELVAFVKKWESDGKKILPQSGRLVFPTNGEKWRVDIRKHHGKVMQSGRFKCDEDFWKKGLDASAAVAVRRKGTRLTFTLTSKKDFDFFEHSISNLLKDKELRDESPG
jgi:RecB family endonuclease NucS